jgi:transposase
MATKKKAGRPRKFDREKAREVRKFYNQTDGATLKTTALQFGVSVPTVQAIVHGTGSYTGL